MWPQARPAVRLLGRVRSCLLPKSLRPLSREATWAARVLAFWLGSFSLLSAATGLANPALDENLWWLDLRTLGAGAALAHLVSGTLFVAFALRPARRGRRRALTAGSAVVLALAALSNLVSFYVEWARGAIRPGTWIPLSAIVCVLLCFVARVSFAPSVFAARSPWRMAVFVSAVFVVGLPLLQLGFFGTTDYRRAADVIVVLGAKARDDGSASTSLSDRVLTAVELYREGWANALVMSGGTGPNGVDESQVMAALARSRGVPAQRILLDGAGVNSEATVHNTVRIFRQRGYRRILVVSHFYHLPRLQLGYQRAGYDVFTVPARSPVPIPGTPWSIAREVPAFWLYYLRGLGG